MVVMEGARNIHIVFHKTHCGHGTNLERCYPTTEERAILAGKMADGVSLDNLLDQICDNIANIYDPKILLTRRDFSKYSKRLHVDTRTSSSVRLCQCEIMDSTNENSRRKRKSNNLSRTY